MDTRFPACSEAAEGSKPQYTVCGVSSSFSISGSVTASTRPRAFSSSNSVIYLSLFVSLRFGFVFIRTMFLVRANAH